MIVNLKFDLDQRRLNRIITNVRRAGSGQLLKQVDINRHGKSALKYLLSIFPKSHSPGGSRSRGSRNEFGMPLWQGWTVDEKLGSQSLEFALYNVLSRNPRAATVLESLDKGSAAFSYKVSSLAKFKDPKFGWTTLVPGRTVNRGARSGIDYIAKTYDFIVDVMVPRLQDEIRRKAKKMIEE